MPEPPVDRYGGPIAACLAFWGLVGKACPSGTGCRCSRGQRSGGSKARVESMPQNSWMTPGSGSWNIVLYLANRADSAPAHVKAQPGPNGALDINNNPSRVKIS